MSQLPPGPPPPPGAQGPPSQPPGYGGYGGPPPPGAPPPGSGGYGGYGGPPPPGGPPPSGGYGAPPASGGRSKGPLVAVLAVVAVLLLVAAAGIVFAVTRGGDGTADLTASEMGRALLDEDDVGNGFVEDGSDDDEDDPTELDDLDADAECLDLLEELEDQDNVVFDSTSEPGDEDVPQAEVSFSNEDDDTDLDQAITVDADDALDGARRVTETCGEIEIDDGESVGQVEYALGDPVDVGDESLTLELTVTIEEPFEVEVEFEGVLWVRDGILSSLLLTGALDDDLESTPPDRELLEELAVEADEKLQQVIDEDG